MLGIHKLTNELFIANSRILYAIAQFNDFSVWVIFFYFSNKRVSNSLKMEIKNSPCRPFDTEIGTAVQTNDLASHISTENDGQHIITAGLNEFVQLHKQEFLKRNQRERRLKNIWKILI